MEIAIILIAAAKAWANIHCIEKFSGIHPDKS